MEPEQRISIGIADRVMNVFIRRVLQVRGGPRWFGDTDAARERLRAPKMLPTMEKKPNSTQAAAGASESALLCGMLCHLFLPAECADSGKAVLYLPGGAFVNNATAQHLAFARRLANKSGAAVFLLSYPTVPDGNFHTVLPVLTEIVRTLFAEYGAHNVTVAGDSAGGTLALTLTQWLKKAGLPAPRRLLLYSPLTDMACAGADARHEKPDPMFGTGKAFSVFFTPWMDGASFDNPLVNPAASSFDFSAVPPVTIFCGTDDKLTPDTILFSRRACAAGAACTAFVYESLFHVFVLFPQPSAKRVTAKSVSLILED